MEIAAAASRPSTASVGAEPDSGTLAGRGSSNSRSCCSRDRPPPSRRQVAAVALAHEEGRIDALEAERLVGFLLMVQHVPIDDRTARRRWARLHELGVPDRTLGEQLAWELKLLLEAGEITAAAAERRAGQFVMAMLAAGRADEL